MRLKRIFIRVLACCLFAVCIFPTNAAGEEDILSREQTELNQVQNVDAKKPFSYEIDEESNITQIKLVSVGDIMMHEEQIASGYHADTRTYDYHYMFEPVKGYIESGDLAIGNLEVTLAGKEKKYTGYPRFNAPDELADALRDTGFDVLTTANNHSLDRNYQGVSHTLQLLDQAGVAHTGSSRSIAEQNTILIKEVKGAKIAFLAYTYGTNGISFENGKSFCVNLIDKDKIKKDIAKAKAFKADLICVSVHFGEENKRMPNKMQKETVDFLVSQGADIILGNHPHVLQSLEIRKVKQGAQSREAVILYSQGNFVSTQRERYQDSSAVFNITIEMNRNVHTMQIKSVVYMPIWTDLSRLGKQYHFRILPIEKYMYLYQAKKDSLLSKTDYSKLTRSLKDVRQILRGNDKRIFELH